MSRATKDLFSTCVESLSSRRSLLGMLGGAVVAPGLSDLLVAGASKRKRRKHKLTKKEKRCRRESKACKQYRSTFCASNWPGDVATCTADLHACCDLIAKCKHEAEVVCYANSPWLVT
jgi:hypothetical protein